MTAEQALLDRYAPKQMRFTEAELRAMEAVAARGHEPEDEDDDEHRLRLLRRDCGEIESARQPFRSDGDETVLREAVRRARAPNLQDCL